MRIQKTKSRWLNETVAGFMAMSFVDDPLSRIPKDMREWLDGFGLQVIAKAMRSGEDVATTVIRAIEQGFPGVLSREQKRDVVRYVQTRARELGEAHVASRNF